ncbi:DNA-protecting protein DprA [Aerococcaceae bacterium DSM 111021]|nr:DNA-protecting protein DprA [Aerococcaceae bacterium DSM 111021]
MKLKIKEQLIFLKSKNVSHKVLSDYLLVIMDRKLLLESVDAKECQIILLQVKHARKYISDKRIDFREISVSDLAYYTRLSKYSMMIGEYYYPMLWYHTAQPPILVFYRGDISLIREPKVSVIGTRKATSYGKNMTFDIVDALSDNNWVSVSGLALGIDASVHERSINHPQGKSIAIIPCGLDYYYPRANKHIQKRMEQDHLILSEYLPNEKPMRHHFILRNRLVAGLSKATIVIEAAQKSGSLITANYALQYNREVFSIPGRIIDDQSRGCNELIHLGATPVLDTQMLISDLREIFQLQGY